MDFGGVEWKGCAMSSQAKISEVIEQLIYSIDKLKLSNCPEARQAIEHLEALMDKEVNYTLDELFEKQVPLLVDFGSSNRVQAIPLSALEGLRRNI